jgi:cholesterol transport system auxiliary component
MNPADDIDTRRRALLRAAALTLPAALLAGCADLIPGQGAPPNLYRLTPKSTFPDDLPTVDWQLVLAQPDADAALDTTRIALIREATKIEYYAKSGWTDRAPSMVQTLMLESFENSKRIVAVGRRAIGLRADFELRTELREFQAEYSQSEIAAHVAINAKLVRAAERSIVGQQNFLAKAPAAVDDIEVIVQAFDDALGSVLKHLVEWTLKTGAANYKPPI